MSRTGSATMKPNDFSDRMVVFAVRSEPVSGGFLRFTGNLQGILSVLQ